jgi:predicted lipoprotein with Yx(FWY)xxD motif
VTTTTHRHRSSELHRESGDRSLGMDVNIQAGRDVVTTMEKLQRPGLGWQRLVLRVSGAGLLVATGAIHLDLYLTGYRSIPTIGGLFLLQVIAAFGLGAVVLASGSRLASGAGAVFALSTLGGYLLSLRIGLFGFREVRTAAGIVAGLIEVAAFATLAALALAPGAPRQPVGPAAHESRLLDRLQAGIPGAGRVVAAFSILALVLLGISVAATESTNTGSSGAILKIAKIRGVAVVTNARGFTLYWFASDTPAKANCNGTCAVYWPPVIGIPADGPGVTGTLGMIKRSDGVTQATYDRHPLYTYVGDSAPGEDNGNNINLNGGEWHEMVTSD